jgi:hypothetical protein
MTKSEARIIEKVRSANAHRALAGLGTSPTSDNFNNKEHRFVKRLYEAKLIIWVPYHSDLGSGWALPGVDPKCSWL